MKKIIIIGAGLAGCTCARLLAEKNFQVEIYEKKAYPGGQIYDCIDEHGVLIHQYGPHIFHTSYDDVWEFVNRFCKFNDYINQVLVEVNGKLVEFPINLNSLKALFPNDYSTLLDEVRTIFGNDEVISISDLLKRLKRNESINIIKYIFNHVYANYSAKMWGKDINDISEQILSRVKLNFNHEWNYFVNDKYQGLPIDGYSVMINRILNHPNIKLLCNQKVQDLIEFKDDYIAFKEQNHLIIYTGPIDELCQYQFGHLDYRSLKIEFETFFSDSFQQVGVINYPADPKMTRICEYKKLTKQNISHVTTISKEYPGSYDCTSSDYNVPFYPVNDVKNNEIFQQYFHSLAKYKNLYLVGRLAQYRYYDMDDVIKECYNLIKKID